MLVVGGTEGRQREGLPWEGCPHALKWPGWGGVWLDSIRLWVSAWPCRWPRRSGQSRQDVLSSPCYWHRAAQRGARLPRLALSARCANDLDHSSSSGALTGSLTCLQPSMLPSVPRLRPGDWAWLPCIPSAWHTLRSFITWGLLGTLQNPAQHSPPPPKGAGELETKRNRGTETKGETEMERQRVRAVRELERERETPPHPLSESHTLDSHPERPGLSATFSLTRRCPCDPHPPGPRPQPGAHRTENTCAQLGGPWRPGPELSPHGDSRITQHRAMRAVGSAIAGKGQARGLDPVTGTSLLTAAVHCPLTRHQVRHHTQASKSHRRAVL